MSRSPDVLITLAEIARIAGVGRAAVSNWRRRHADFPLPIGGTDASPQFSISSVEEWLQHHAKLTGVGRLDRLWPEFEALGDIAQSGAMIAAVGERILARQADCAIEVSSDFTGDAELLIQRAVDVASDNGDARTFDYLIERWSDTYVRQLSATPPQLAALMIETAQLVWGSGGDLTGKVILDPSCGIGGLLLAAAQSELAGKSALSSLSLLGVDRESTLAALAAVRLGFFIRSARESSATTARVKIRVGDSLRADPHGDVQADIIVCNPPFGERDWGHEELATDQRWVFGLPARTESELAWVEHAIARLRPGGVAVMLMPPGVASRRAGRRVRAALLRSGALRGVIALPAGSAQPHGVSLHLWILGRPDSEQDSRQLFVMDAKSTSVPNGAATDMSWSDLRKRVVGAIRDYPWQGRRGPDTQAAPARGCAVVPVINLLDEYVDITPARHIPDAGPAAVDLPESWMRFGGLLRDVGKLSQRLSTLDPSTGDLGAAKTTVADLDRAGALDHRVGQPLPTELREGGEGQPDAVPVLTVAALMVSGQSQAWLSAEAVASCQGDGRALTVADPGDVLVVGVERAFGAWVHGGGRLVIGPQIHLLRVDLALLDPWFLAGCLQASANVRQASTHASTSARIDVRKLQVLQLPLFQQVPYGQAFHALADLEASLTSLTGVGTDLMRTLSDRLANGGLTTT
jgi:predicted RNA methylase/predicted DNA-binding transcriptional regulator AlpA